MKDNLDAKIRATQNLKKKKDRVTKSAYYIAKELEKGIKETVTRDMDGQKKIELESMLDSKMKSMDLRSRKGQKGVFKLVVKEKNLEKDMRHNKLLNNTLMPVLCDFIISGGQDIDKEFKKREKELSEGKDPYKRQLLFDDIKLFYTDILQEQVPEKMKKTKKRKKTTKKTQSTKKRAKSTAKNKTAKPKAKGNKPHASVGSDNGATANAPVNTPQQFAQSNTGKSQSVQKIDFERIKLMLSAIFMAMTHHLGSSTSRTPVGNSTGNQI